MTGDRAQASAEPGSQAVVRRSSSGHADFEGSCRSNVEGHGPYLPDALLSPGVGDSKVIQAASPSGERPVETSVI